MILRRFMQHVREQNWFAVGLDVIVVIVGIFLGLQVQAWYEEIADRKQEAIYLERLHVEIEAVETELIEYRDDEYKRYFTLLTEFADALSTNNGDIELTGRHCFAASFSHIFLVNSATLPTMNELVSSGQLSLLSDPQLRQDITNFLIEEEQNQQTTALINTDRLELGRKYPDLMTYDFGNTTSYSALVRVNCDFEKIRQSSDFKNDLISNMRRMYGFSLGQFDSLNELREIRERIEEILGITHE